jgi:S-adenosylmethionine uptake transporter
MSSSLESIGKYIFLGAFGFMAWTIGDATIRHLNGYSPYFIASVSTGFSVFLSLLLSSKIGGVKTAFTLPRLKLRILRGVILTIAGFLSYITFSHLELTTAYAILFLSPILAKVLSVFLMKESISPQSWGITVLGFIGVIIVLRPGIVPLSVGSIAALTQVFFFALGHIMARYIGKENQTLFSMVIFQYAFIAIGTAYPAYLAFDGVIISDLMLMLLIGVTGLSGAFMVSYAFACAPSAYIAPLHYTQIVWGLVWGALLFNEYPDIYVTTGSTVIILSGLLLVRHSRKVNKMQQRAA